MPSGFFLPRGILPLLKSDDVGNLQEFLRILHGNAGSFSMVSAHVSICKVDKLISFSINRHEKDGVQDKAVA